MSEVISVSSEGSTASVGFEAFANLNDGFLGTGLSSSAEIAFIAMALIFSYVAISTFRYIFPEVGFFKTIVVTLGLRDS